jgi:hypothetical protein
MVLQRVVISLVLGLGVLLPRGYTLHVCLCDLTDSGQTSCCQPIEKPAGCCGGDENSPSGPSPSFDHLQVCSCGELRTPSEAQSACATNVKLLALVAWIAARPEAGAFEPMPRSAVHDLRADPSVRPRVRVNVPLRI